MRAKRFLIPGLALFALGGAPTAMAASGGTGVPGSTGTTTSKTTSAKRRHKKAKPKSTTFNNADTSPGSGGAGVGSGGGATGTGSGSGTGSESGTGSGSGTSGSGSNNEPTVQGDVAKIIDGEAYAPSDAPLQVQKAIWAGDAIRHKPYIYGGGHGTWKDAGYDCSGSVSYVLHAAGLLKTADDSSQFETWGQSGVGQWITVYTNPGHAFIQIAGIRLDTSAEQDPNAPSGSGPRWRPLMTNTSGYQARHPLGF